MPFPFAEELVSRAEPLCTQATPPPAVMVVLALALRCAVLRRICRCEVRKDNNFGGLDCKGSEGVFGAGHVKHAPLPNFWRRSRPRTQERAHTRWLRVRRCGRAPAHAQACAPTMLTRRPWGCAARCALPAPPPRSGMRTPGGVALKSVPAKTADRIQLVDDLGGTAQHTPAFACARPLAWHVALCSRQATAHLSDPKPHAHVPPAHGH